MDRQAARQPRRDVSQNSLNRSVGAVGAVSPVAVPLEDINLHKVGPQVIQDVPYENGAE